jgi:L,D-peptidoglycan transpeptidase YkuD (ErfK/YbiS/YcfS/YnhG family)
MQGLGATMIFTATSDGRLDIAGRQTDCVLGRSGVRPAADKREGDGASPLGLWPLRRVLYRPDREPRPATRLPVAAVSPEDGWCDAPGDPAYNQPVRLPYSSSAEQLWREDRVYDLIIILGHNDDPPVSPMGSAIFLHLIQPDGAPTAGCVAVSREDMLDLLARARPGDALAILQADPREIQFR